MPIVSSARTATANALGPIASPPLRITGPGSMLAQLGPADEPLVVDLDFEGVQGAVAELLPADLHEIPDYELRHAADTFELRAAIRSDLHAENHEQRRCDALDEALELRLLQRGLPLGE